MSTPEELEVVVAELSWEADGVVAVGLAPLPDGPPLPAWTPGAHLTVRLRPGLERQYSLCGDPVDARYRIAVRHCPRGRGGSDYVHRFLRPGRRLRISAPRNHFDLLPAASYAFVAGGIGITPILPMVRRAEADGIPWTLAYVGRERATMAFVDRLTRLDAAESTTGPRAPRSTVWASGTAGRFDLTGHLDAHRREHGRARVYGCGPTSMMDALEELCAQRADLVFHGERFRAPGADTAPGRPFDVRCTRSGLDLHVDADRSLLDVLAAAGLPVAGSCREGLCGTCEVVVRAGDPDHRDHVGLGDRTAPRVMAACVSRALTPGLELEL
ncbi:PDR/VanB family oxidoreductase [Nocardioides sp. LHD-245]|uniref:PDR/VanB family oxidoreductase n=1 Tax=Nocardioides sp. LHD-245 TaxID=3051387 RepID=UPI0027DF8C46|nr:PDR/VanB family oxidoreductase [Nocardioides sp. LHD-245]